MFFGRYRKEKIISKAFEQIEDKAYNPRLRDDDISQLNDVEKTIFIAYTFDMEVMNGGLSQFFVNSSAQYAPYISDVFEKIGAVENKLLFEGFVKENNIDLNDLSIFNLESLSDYSYRVCKLFDYDKFDDNYSDITNLLAKYIVKKYK